MVKGLTNYLIIDWGFTRFKLWFLDENKKVIKDSFSIIKDINKKAEEYHMIREYEVSRDFLDVQKKLEKLLPDLFEAINYYEDA